MGAFGAIEIPNKALADAQKVLAELEKKLADAEARRLKILEDIRRVGIDIDKNKADGKARATQGTLNKQEIAEGRLIKSIEMEIKHAAKQLSLAQDQVAAAALQRAKLDSADVPRDKLYEVVCPDGVRRVRHRHHSIDGLQKVLTPGYRVVAEVFGAGDGDKGGFAAPIGSDIKSNMLEGLLQAHGDTLLAWLAEKGIGGPVIVLPSNNRE